MILRIWLLTELLSKSTWKVLARHTERGRGEARVRGRMK
jgi:hypothetical protein